MRVSQEIRRREVLAMARDCCERLAQTAKPAAPRENPFRFQAQTDERGVTAEMRELMARQASEQSPFHPTGG